MNLTQFKEYRNEIHEGVTGPTRMEIQKFFDKEKGTQRARLNKTSSHFNIRDVIVNAKGTVVGYKMEEVETEKYDPEKPAYAGSRHKRIEKDKYRKRKGYAAMTDDIEIDEGYEKTISLWMKNAFSGVEFHFKNGSLYVDKGYRGKVARRMAVDKIKAPVGGIKETVEKEARTYRDRQDDDERKKRKRFAFGGKQDNIRSGGKGYGKHGEEVEEVDEDAKMGKQTDDNLRKIYKKALAMDQSSPANKFMTKRIAKEMKKRGLKEEEIEEKKSNLDREGAYKVGTKVTVDGKKGEINYVQHSKDHPKYPHSYKITDLSAKGEYKSQKRLEGGSHIPHNRIKEEVMIDEKKKEKPPVFKGTPRQIRQQYKDWKKKNDKLHIGEDYAGSDDKKVFDMLSKAGWRLGVQGDTLVRNMLKKHKGDVKKTAKDIMKKYPQMKKEEVEVDEAKSAYDKEIAAFLKKGGKIKKLAVSKKEVAKAAAEFRKSHQKMTQKEIELDLEDEIEAMANAEGVIVADNNIFLISESISEKDYDDLKKGDTVALEYGSAMSSGTAKFKVTAKNVVNKGKVGKVTLKSVAKPNSVKFYLYKRGNKVSAAQGDMGISVKSFRIEEVDILDQITVLPVFESQDLQAKMALDDAGIKWKLKNNSITIKKRDLKKAQKAFEKSFKKGGWPTLKTEEVITEAADRDEVLEFKAFIENDPRLEKQKIIPIVKNIQRRMEKGTYDHKKAPKLWMYLVKDAAKLYAKEFDGLTYDSAVHKEVAQQLADDYKAEIEAQDGKMYESKFHTHFQEFGEDEEDTIEEQWYLDETYEVLTEILLEKKITLDYSKAGSNPNSPEAKMKKAFDDAGIKMKPRDGKIVVAKKDKEKARATMSKSPFGKASKKVIDMALDKFFIFEVATITEVLKSKDKSVIDAFYDKKPLEGRMLSTDGMTLEKSGMGSQQIAHWVKGKIKITAVSDVKSTEEIVRYMKKSIPSGVFEDRDYRKEYDNYQGKPEQIARRSSRNQARRVMGDKTEEGKDVGHKDNNPMNNDPKNLRNEDPSKNRREPRLRKVESFSDYFNRPFVTESSRNDIYNGSISAGVELEKYAKKSGGIDKDDMLATAAILKKGKLPSIKQIPGDTDPRDKIFSIIGKHLNKKYLKKYKGFSPALDQAMKEEWELEERKLSDTEVKRREEIAQDLDDADFKKRYGDDWKSVKMGVATNMAKKEAMESVNYVWFEARYKYKIDHKTYTSAVEEALIVADKQGYEVDMDDYFDKIATGPRKPQEGKTNIFKIALEKGGKEQKKRLQIQIYGKGKHGYELNCYIQ